MDKNAYVEGVAALYAAEVLGEGSASRWLQLTSEPAHQYRLAAGAAVAQRFASLPWKEAVATLAKPAFPYVHQFQALFVAAPPGDAPLVSLMVNHEQSVVRIAEGEAAGDGKKDRELEGHHRRMEEPCLQRS